MATIFVSYKREDFSQVERLVSALRGGRLDVWWDQDIEPNAPWEATIEQHLNASAVAIVAWSPLAVDSERVKAEARHAREASKLVQIFLRPCQAPFFFRERQVLDLSDWMGDANSAQFQQLLALLRQFGCVPPSNTEPAITGLGDRSGLVTGLVDRQAALAFADRGRSHLENEDYDGALSDFEEATRRDISMAAELQDEIAEALVQRGRGYVDDLEFDQALEAFEEAIEHNSCVADEYESEIAEAFKICGRENLELGYYDQALEVFEKAIKLYPSLEVELSHDMFALFLERIRAYLNEKDYNSAIEEFEDAISRNADFGAKLKAEILGAVTDALECDD